MMRFLLFLILCVLAFNDISGNGLSLGAGMSVKNLLVYMGAAWLLLQNALGRPVKVELQTIQTCFAVLILYAAVTMFIANEYYTISGLQALRQRDPSQSIFNRSDRVFTRVFLRRSHDC